jgi:hypothetical protein
MVDEELVLYAGVLGNLAQARTLESSDSEYVKRRGKDARAAVRRICPGAFHAVSSSARRRVRYLLSMWKVYHRPDFPNGKSWETSGDL